MPLPGCGAPSSRVTSQPFSHSALAAPRPPHPAPTTATRGDPRELLEPAEPVALRALALTRDRLRRGPARCLEADPAVLRCAHSAKAATGTDQKTALLGRELDTGATADCAITPGVTPCDNPGVLQGTSRCSRTEATIIIEELWTTGLSIVSTAAAHAGSSTVRPHHPKATGHQSGVFASEVAIQPDTYYLLASEVLVSDKCATWVN